MLHALAGISGVTVAREEERYSANQKVAQFPAFPVYVEES